MPFPTVPPPLLHQVNRAHPTQYLVEDFVVVFYLDSAGLEVAAVAKVQGVAESVVLGPVLADGLATPEVELPYLHGFEHLPKGKGPFQTQMAF